MTRQIRFSLLVSLAFGLAACGGAQDAAEPAADVQKDDVSEDAVARTPGRPGTMFQVDYTIIGTPIVGSPVSIDLDIRSAYEGESVDIGYQVPDPSALIMDDTQPRNLTRAPFAGERSIRERVTVIPQREGRLYINVSAGRTGREGTSSTMISIPIHVGDVDTSPVEHGELETNADDETTRVLTSE